MLFSTKRKPQFHTCPTHWPRFSPFSQHPINFTALRPVHYPSSMRVPLFRPFYNPFDGIQSPRSPLWPPAGRWNRLPIPACTDTAISTHSDFLFPLLDPSMTGTCSGRLPGVLCVNACMLPDWKLYTWVVRTGKSLTLCAQGRYCRNGTSSVIEG